MAKPPVAFTAKMFKQVIEEDLEYSLPGYTDQYEETQYVITALEDGRYKVAAARPNQDDFEPRYFQVKVTVAER